MKSKTLIYVGVGLLVLILAGIIGYNMLMSSTKKHSPADVANYVAADWQMSVDYCRPSKKGRVIFGTEAEGALLPYGVYWRAGANEATEFETNKDITFGGQALQAGRYVLYAIPGESTWTIGLNTDLGRWGYNEVDHEDDVLSVQIPSQNDRNLSELFTIEFTQVNAELVLLNLKWDQTEVSVPITP